MSKTGIRIALALTLIWIAFWCFTLYLEWQTFIKLSFNEVGDFMAGIFGPFAFLWLVLGFFQQSAELKNSVEALRAQEQELSNAAKAQAELATANKSLIDAQLVASNRTIWLEACHTELLAKNNLAYCSQILEDVKASRKAAMSARGMLNSGAMQQFENKLEEKEREIEKYLKEIELETVLTSGPAHTISAARISRTYQIQILSEQILRFLEQELSEDRDFTKERRQSLNIRIPQGINKTLGG
ncbi:hypothetical protein [Celeribacter sp.]|uniref:hypothetical protein n=1 Tax=Celeribacter sp. TaxID=1890673 RepID=UPI003A8D1205